MSAAHQASAAPTGPDPQQAAAYLTAPAQLVDGHYYDPFGLGQADWGLTIDGALALAAQGGKDAAYGKLVDFLAANGKDPAGTDVISWTGIGTEFVDGGSIGKLALLAEVAGRDPHQFAGHDLVAELAKATCTSTTPIGQSPCAAAGNYAGGSSVFKQALGLIGQVRGGAGDVAVAPAAAYLSACRAPTAAGRASSRRGSHLRRRQHRHRRYGPHPRARGRRGGRDGTGDRLGGGHPARRRRLPRVRATRQRARSQHQLHGARRAGAAALGGDHSAQIAKALTFLAGTQNGDGGFDIDSANDFSDVRATAQVVGGIVGRSYATLLHSLGASAHAVTGAAYLVGRLTDGTHLESSFDDGQGGTVTFVDYGLTADLALALASANSQDATLAKVVGYLRAHVGDYVDQSGAAGGPYSGAAGKLAVLAESTGQSPSAFGGVDLLALLTGNVCTTGNPDPNAFDPCTAAGDFRGAYSGVSQALAVLALGRAGVAVPAPALTRLGQLQCADGGFTSVLIAPGAACTSDVDTTGYAVQALSLQPSGQASVARGWEYLRGAQSAGGGWSGAAGVNSNSTGLATQAVLALLDRGGYVATAATSAKAAALAAVAGGSTPAGSVNGAQAAYGFLVGLQRPDGGFDVSSTEAGDDGTRTRATTQAVPALAGAFLTTLVDPVTPVDPAPPTTTTTTSTTPPTSTTSTTSTTTDPSSTTSSTSATTPPTSTGSASSTPSGGSTPAGTVAASGGLASTGIPVGLIVAVGVLLLLAGLVLLVGRRMTAGGDCR